VKRCDLHALMLAQATERRETARPIAAGDVLQLEDGGYIEVVHAASAGVLLDERAHREIWKRGSAAEACALHGGSATWKECE
jgi:hypothetical protein